MWFNEFISNLLGAILGSSIGVFGGIWGTLAGINSRKGKHKKAILITGLILIIIGLISLLTGVTALIYSQPRHVWYPFILIGIITIFVFIPTYISIKKVYMESEFAKTKIRDL